MYLNVLIGELCVHASGVGKTLPMFPPFGGFSFVEGGVSAPAIALRFRGVFLTAGAGDSSISKGSALRNKKTAISHSTRCVES